MEVVPLKMINRASKAICKINIMEKERQTQGSGFFMIINDKLKCLVTCQHIVHSNLVDNSISIEIYGNKLKEIKLNNRYMEFFKDLDISIIEIKDSDDFIQEVEFFETDLNYINGYDQYNNISIFILQYAKGELSVSSGKIIEILDNHEFGHNAGTDFGSAGSPIILINSSKVIGIHKAKDKDRQIKYGSFIGEMIKRIKV